MRLGRRADFAALTPDATELPDPQAVAVLVGDAVEPARADVDQRGRAPSS